MNNLFGLFLSLFTLAAVSTPSYAMDPKGVPDFAVFVRVLDVGDGQAIIARLPGGHHIMFDVGVGDGIDPGIVLDEVKKIATHNKLDLVIISSDSPSHFSALPLLYDRGIKIARVIRTGNVESGSTGRKLNRLLRKKSKKDASEQINLSQRPLPIGSQFNFGEVSLNILSGFSEYPYFWERTNFPGKDADALKRGAIGLVLKLDYRGAGILFTGDILGVDPQNPDEAIATEKFLIQNMGVFPLRAEALIVPAGGANIASSKKFIESVTPAYLAISASNSRGLPDNRTMNRYLDFGVQAENIFRTDLGDDEISAARRLNREDVRHEWDFGRNENEIDKAGDEHIDILICPNGKVRAAYATEPMSCVW